MREEYVQLFTKNKLLLAIVLFILLSLGLVSLSGGFILIKSKNDIEGYVVPANIEDGTELDEVTTPINITKGGWGLIYKPLGEYKLELRDNELKTRYSRDITPFSWHIIDASFSKQLKADNLGLSPSDCVHEPKNKKQTIYFFCNKFTDNQYFASSTADGSAYKDIPTGLVTKQYQDGLLSVFEGTGESPISMSRLDFRTSPAQQKWSGDSSLEKYYSDMNPNYFATEQDSPRFAFFNKDTNEVLVYDNFQDTAARKIDVSSYVEDSDGVNLEFRLHSNTLYILNTVNRDALEGVGDISPQKVGFSNQSISAVSLQTGKKLDTTIEIPVSSPIKSIDIDGSGNALANTQKGESADAVVYKYQNKAVQEYKLPSDMISNACWFKDSFVYLSADSGELYLHSDKDNSSRMMYSNPSDNVVGIQCREGGVYFLSLSKDSQQNSSDYRWFRLTDSELQSGDVAPEGVLPIINDSLTGIDWAYQYKNILYITLQKNNTCTVTLGDRSTLATNLSLLGIDSSEYRLVVTRTC